MSLDEITLTRCNKTSYIYIFLPAVNWVGCSLLSTSKCHALFSLLGAFGLRLDRRWNGIGLSCDIVNIILCWKTSSIVLAWDIFE